MSRESETRRQVDKQLSFALYGAANRIMRMHRPFLEPLGLTFPQYLVVLELLDTSPQLVGKVGIRLGLDTGTITPILKRMEQSGLIARKRDMQDERRVLVELTPAGQALQTSVWAVSDQIMSACQITDSQADELREELDRLRRPATPEEQLETVKSAPKTRR
ncbi:MarR family winged helix-turn-helix transcriptional regulator [Paracoccus marcusii]|uniref:MarR family winged helix-turn-helix transcriptional regulator n=1 Tax=Paracoccus marcusii TaxID=59779 RepID=UPI0035A5DFAC